MLHGQGAQQMFGLIDDAVVRDRLKPTGNFVTNEQSIPITKDTLLEALRSNSKSIFFSTYHPYLLRRVLGQAHALQHKTSADEQLDPIICDILEKEYMEVIAYNGDNPTLTVFRSSPGIINAEKDRGNGIIEKFSIRTKRDFRRLFFCASKDIFSLLHFIPNFEAPETETSNRVRAFGSTELLAKQAQSLLTEAQTQGLIENQHEDIYPEFPN